MGDNRFAIIGAGTWGEVHIQAYQQHPEAQLVAICDMNEEKARALAKKYNIPGYYKDYKEMLEKEKIGTVSIATPDYTHREPAVYAAQCGKNVMLEKPLATTIEDAEAIVNAVKRAGVKMMVDFHNRWNHPFAAAKEALDEGKLGELQLAYGRQSCGLPWARAIGWTEKTKSVWFAGSHTVDLMRWYFNDEVERVFAVSRSKVLKKEGIDTEDFFECILEFKNGGVGVVENSWLVPASDPAVEDFQFELVGSEGSAYLDTFHDRSSVIYGKTKAVYPDMFVTPRVYGKIVGFAIQSIMHFADCVINDRQQWITEDDGLVNVKTILAIIESAEKRQPVNIKY